CRIGSTRGVELIDRITAGDASPRVRAQLDELCDVLEHGSLCALGGLTPYPVRSALALWERRRGQRTGEVH
ncbi:MAG: NADH-ubiquinone oxidoreductase-F iron-sulfur binding region domain-containing protein, partial [Gammaproteobacteria bacterium]